MAKLHFSQGLSLSSAGTLIRRQARCEVRHSRPNGKRGIRTVDSRRVEPGDDGPTGSGMGDSAVIVALYPLPWPD